MNSTWSITALPNPPDEYDRQYMSQLVRAIEEALYKARAPGLVEAQNINISNLPTSATGLRAGDLWNDTGTIKVA